MRGAQASEKGRSIKHVMMLFLGESLSSPVIRAAQGCFGAALGEK